MMVQNKKNPKLVLTIVWGALLWSHIIYLAIPFILVRDDLEPDMTILGVLGAIAFLAPFVSIFGVPAFMGKKAMRTFSLHILQYALIEVTAVLGFMGNFLGAPSIFQYSLGGLGIVSMIYLAPFLRKENSVE